MKQSNILNERVLCISDLHAPWEHPNYLQFLKRIQKKYKTTKTVVIGDGVDFAAISNFETNPDLPSSGDELALAIKHLQPYYKAFPEAYYCMGNHSLRVARRAFKAGLSSHYIKAYKEVINAPEKWQFVDSIVINDVLYRHGDLSAYKKCLQEFQSVVSGHRHTECGIQYFTNNNKTIFGMQIGAAINDESAAFAYAKNVSKRSVLACGVVIDGKHGYIELM